MKRIRKSALWALGIGLLSILSLEAQPGGRGRGGEWRRYVAGPDFQSAGP